MKTRIVVATFATVLAAGLGVRAWAAMNVPAGLSYSGLLRNGGTPETGTRSHNFIFELHDGSTTVCTDTRPGLTVVDGRFDVQGLFASGGCTLDTHFANRPTLSIRITVDGTVLSPPQAIGTVPYAARARVAETTEAVPATVTSGLVKGWVSFNGSSCTATSCPIFDSFNVTSVTRVGAGAYVITWATAFASTSYVVTGACQRTDAVASLMFQIGRGTTANPFTPTTAQVGCGNYDGNALDSGLVNVTAFGR